MNRDEAANKALSTAILKDLVQVPGPSEQNLLDLATAIGNRKGKDREVLFLQRLVGACWDRMTPEAKEAVYFCDEVQKARQDL